MQKKKHAKQILSVILAVIFAFAPIFFAGCNFDPDDSGSTGGSTSGGNSTITTNYKNGDYLNSIKVSYSVSNLSADTQNDEIKEYKDQIISLTQMLAADTMMGLMAQYGVSETQGKTYNLQMILDKSQKSDLTKDVSFGTIPYNYGSKTINFNETTYAYAKQTTYLDSFLGKYDEEQNRISEHWKFYGKPTEQTSIAAFQTILDIANVETTSTNELQLTIGNKNNTNLHKLTYAILSIVDRFDNVSESDFDTTYKAFLNDYDAKAGNGSTDFAKLSENLAFNVKHSGLYANSLESKAFKQFILDRVIGENLVNKDNQLFQVFENGKYTDVSSSSTEKFRGETFYYNKDASYPENPSESDVYDISLYINGSPDDNNTTTCDQLNEKLKLICYGNDTTDDPHISGTGVKLWQDIDNDGIYTETKIINDNGTEKNVEVKKVIEFNSTIGNVAKTSTYVNGNLTEVNVPKYRALVGFRNYDYTVEKIIDRVLTDTENKIQVKNGDNYQPIANDTNYPVIANVFSKNYSYTAVEVKGASKDNSTSCKLPKQAYKSVLLAMKDRTKMSVKNSLGTIYLLLESSEGVKVNVSMYARYYRKGSGFAYFSEGEDTTTFYKFPNGSGQVDGPYGIDFSGPEVKDGCMFELEFEDLFKNAKFKTDDKTYVNNTQTFDYTYTDEDKVTKTVPIYEIKPFPQDYAKSTETSHASVFTGIDYKTKPVYEAQDVKGSTGSLYAYSEKNLVGLGADAECEFIELMFVTDNDNPFTFGFTGFVPQTELYY